MGMQTWDRKVSKKADVGKKTVNKAGCEGVGGTATRRNMDISNPSRDSFRESNKVPDFHGLMRQGRSRAMTCHTDQHVVTLGAL